MFWPFVKRERGRTGISLGRRLDFGRDPPFEIAGAGAAISQISGALSFFLSFFATLNYSGIAFVSKTGGGRGTGQSALPINQIRAGLVAHFRFVGSGDIIPALLHFRYGGSVVGSGSNTFDDLDRGPHPSETTPMQYPTLGRMEYNTLGGG
jgi:hypothetical protein